MREIVPVGSCRGAVCLAGFSASSLLTRFVPNCRRRRKGGQSRLKAALKYLSEYGFLMVCQWIMNTLGASEGDSSPSEWHLVTLRNRRH